MRLLVALDVPVYLIERVQKLITEHLSLQRSESSSTLNCCIGRPWEGEAILEGPAAACIEFEPTCVVDPDDSTHDCPPR